MADRNPLAEAYDMLGSINDAAEQADTDLKALVPKLLQEEKTLQQLLEKVTAQGDETNIARVRMLLDQTQQAWITIQQALGEGESDEPSEGEDPTARSPTPPDDERPATGSEPQTAGSEPTEEPGSPSDAVPADAAADTGGPDATAASDQASTGTDADRP